MDLKYNEAFLQGRKMIKERLKEKRNSTNLIERDQQSRNQKSLFAFKTV